MKYCLKPNFECPFGWPKEPQYPIDLANTNKQASIKHDLDSEYTQSNSDSISKSNSDSQEIEIDLDSNAFTSQINSLYLTTLYSSNLSSSISIQSFSFTLRNLNQNYPSQLLLQSYESFLLIEHLLVRKWNQEFKRIVDIFILFPSSNLNQLQLALDQIQIDQFNHMFQPNEIEIIRVTLQHIHSNYQSLLKPDALSNQIEIWSMRETQLQIILLLELIILTNLTLESGSQLLFHHKQLSSSPRKSSRVKQREGSRDEQVFADLESALEGLIDRMAMWQIISGLENHLTASDKTSSLPTLPNPEVTHSSTLLDLDHVQRFWVEVIEENYTQHLPLLNRSFRPKLFPTSIYDPSASSSLAPTKFEASSRSHHESIESSLLSSVTRTPNLKRLAKRQAVKTRGNRKSSREGNLNLMSPTMIELSGLRRPRTTSRTLPKAQTHSTSLIRSSNILPSHNTISSRSLFNRRQVKMSQVPSKSKLSIPQRTSNRSSVCFKPTTSLPSKSQLNNNFKRKQSSPKRNHETCRTELITTTPRKLIKFNDITNNDKKKFNHDLNSLILVPDTPQK